MDNREQTPPCQARCPLGQSGRDYLKLVADGRLDDAFRLVYEDNPLPASCGRICHKCEPFCNRGQVDAPVRVATIKSFLADRYYAAFPAEAFERHPISGIRVAVIGSGPCGLTAARALTRLGHRVTVFEAMPVAGGQLAIGVPQHRLPREVVKREVDNLVRQGVDLRLASPVDDVERLFDEGFRAVIVTTGSHLSKPHPAVEQGKPGVLLNTEFLRDTKLGRPVRIGMRVLVIGGGNVAMDCARAARRLGLPRVTVSCVESAIQMPAHPHEVEAAAEEGIDILPATTVLSVSRDSDGAILGAVLAPVTATETSPGVVSKIGHDAAASYFLPCDTVLVAIGQTPRADLVSRSPGVLLTPQGAIAVESDGFSTGRQGLFAAGDAVTVVGSVAGAIGAGNRVAALVHRFLTGESAFAAVPTGGTETAFDLDRAMEMIGAGCASANPRLPLRELPADLRIREMADREVDLGMSEEEAIAEAGRCLACGSRTSSQENQKANT